MRKYLFILFFGLMFSVGHAQSLELSGTSDDPQYGFTPDKPVKVGGGPATQREYLNKLIDPQGNHVTYVRTGSCCAYKTNSPSAPFGHALVDVYEVTYRNEKNKKKKVNIYISFYDLEAPMAVYGFSVGR